RCARGAWGLHVRDGRRSPRWLVPGLGGGGGRRAGRHRSARRGRPARTGGAAGGAVSRPELPRGGRGGVSFRDPARCRHVTDILVVEDEPDIRGLIVLHLEREGFRCRIAATGPEALRSVKRPAPPFPLLPALLPQLTP